MKSKIRVPAVAALALLTLHLPAFAGYIIDAAGVVEAQKRGAIVWDIRSEQEYAAGHIPGAVNIGNVGAVLRNPNTEDLLPTAVVENLLNAGGIDLSKEIIVYGHMGAPAAYWELTTVAHFGGKSGSIFHGGIEAWRASGHPVSKEPTRLAAIEQKLVINPDIQIYLQEVKAKVDAPDVQIIDTRSPAEYHGDVINALRGGHIPGAVNIPFEQNWVDPEAYVKVMKGDLKAVAGMALKSTEQLKALYADLDPNLLTITYCQSGVRASETAWILHELGFKKVRVFEESWLGYGNDPSAPAASVQHVNIGLLNHRIQSLEAAVEKLTATVKALQAARKSTGK